MFSLRCRRNRRQLAMHSKTLQIIPATWFPSNKLGFVRDIVFVCIKLLDGCKKNIPPCTLSGILVQDEGAIGPSVRAPYPSGER